MWYCQWINSGTVSPPRLSPHRRSLRVTTRCQRRLTRHSVFLRQEAAASEAWLAEGNSAAAACRRMAPPPATAPRSKGAAGADLALSFLRTAAAQRNQHGAPMLFYAAALAGLEDATAAPVRCGAVLTVTPPLCHFGGAMNGGAIAALVDIVGAAALLTLKPAGMSVSITTHYFARAPLGARVVVDAEVIKAGRSVATIEVQLRLEKDGTLVAQGTHIMYASDAARPLEEYMVRYRPQQQESGAEEEQKAGEGEGDAAGSGAGGILAKL